MSKKYVLRHKILVKIFGREEKRVYLCTRKTETGARLRDRAGEAGALSGISDSTAASRGISGTRSRTGLPEISEKIFLKKVSKKFAGMKNPP